MSGEIDMAELHLAEVRPDHSLRRKYIAPKSIPKMKVQDVPALSGLDDKSGLIHQLTDIGLH